jgi:alkyl hydroperoxide reductase subunit AhpC
MEKENGGAVAGAGAGSENSDAAEAATVGEKTGGRKRPVQIKFRVTEAERGLILEKMGLLKTANLAAYLRKMAIDGYIINADYSDVKAMTAEIQKVGVNVNQIARRVNATGSVYEQDIAEIKKALDEIWRLQRLNLLKQR